MASFVSLLTILLWGGFASGRQKNYPTANDKRWEAFKPWLHFRLSSSILHKRVSWAATACPKHTQYILTFHQTIRNPFTMFICSSNPPPENALHVVDQIYANTKTMLLCKTRLHGLAGAAQNMQNASKHAMKSDPYATANGSDGCCCYCYWLWLLCAVDDDGDDDHAYASTPHGDDYWKACGNRGSRVVQILVFVVFFKTLNFYCSLHIRSI